MLSEKGPQGHIHPEATSLLEVRILDTPLAGTVWWTDGGKADWPTQQDEVSAVQWRSKQGSEPLGRVT